MANIQSTKNNFNVTPSEVSTKERKPVFVDNALHIAKYESQNNTIPKATISASPYQVATEKRYAVEEEESSMLLSHVKTPGHTSKTTVFTPYGTDTSSNLLYDGDDTSKRLVRKRVENLTEKIRLHLPNMKGRTFTDLGLSSSFHMAQPTNVGLRASDLALELSKEVEGTVSSIMIGERMTPTNAYTQRRRHSNSFFAFNFNNMNLIAALRLLARKDNRVLDYDNFGNVLFLPFNYSKKRVFINEEFRFGNKQDNPVDDIQNRITIKGTSLALNDDVTVTVNDGSKQQGKFDLDIIENSSPIQDATVRTSEEARRVARQVLRANNVMRGSISTSGHLDKFYLRPGDIVRYGDKEFVIMEAKHSMSNRLSDFNFLSLQSGVEGVLQSIEEGTSNADDVQQNELTKQIEDIDFNFFDSIDIESSLIIVVREYSTGGFMIGGNAGRGTIGGAGDTIGMKYGLSELFVGDV